VLTKLLAEQLTCIPHVWEVESLTPRLAKSYTTLQQFAIASTSMQVDVLPWCFVIEMGTVHSLHTWLNMVNIMKGLILCNC